MEALGNILQGTLEWNFQILQAARQDLNPSLNVSKENKKDYLTTSR